MTIDTKSLTTNQKDDTNLLIRYERFSATPAWRLILLIRGQRSSPLQSPPSAPQQWHIDGERWGRAADAQIINHHSVINFFGEEGIVAKANTELVIEC